MRAETKRVGWHAVTELMGTQARQEDVERHSRKERELHKDGRGENKTNLAVK